MRQKKQTTRGLICRLAAIALTLIAVFAVAMLLLHAWEERHGRFSSVEANQNVSYNGKNYRLKKDMETVLILGLDKMDVEIDPNSYRNDRQADFLLLIMVDHKNKSCTALQINRDTLTEVQVLGLGGEVIDHVVEQIALSHGYGSGGKDSCANASTAVSRFLHNAPVDHYLSLTMEAVPIWNDLVGGVTLTVQDDLTPIDPTLVKGETVKLSGEQAMRYIRARSGLEDATNIARMGRQRQYIRELLNSTLEKIKSDDDFSTRTLSKISEYMVTDLTSFQLETLFDKMSDYEFGEILTIQGESKRGDRYMEFRAEEPALREQILALFYDEVA